MKDIPMLNRKFIITFRDFIYSMDSNNIGNIGEKEIEKFVYSKSNELLKWLRSSLSVYKEKLTREM